jgi:iron complex transport system substrate-binding protein
MSSSPPRIASFLPSTTEIVCALGLRDQLVLRSHECDHPRGVEAVPFATWPKYDPDGTSYAIDQRLRALLQEGLGVFRVDADRLREAAPDVILTQDQCQVCAVPLADIEAAACALLDPPPRIVSLSPATLGEVLDSVVTVAAALGVPERGEALRQELEAGLRRVGDRAASVGSGRPRVLTIEWFDPLMTAGNWVPELVELAGGENALGEAGAHSPFLSWDVMAATDPDVVVLIPCGFGIERALEEMPVLRALPGWGDLRAVRDGHVAVADGNRYFNRPGPRLVESAEILGEILSEVAGRGGKARESATRHRNDGWRWVDRSH